MKKLILALLFLLLSCPVFAENQQLAWMGPMIVGGSTPAASCGTIDSFEDTPALARSIAKDAGYEYIAVPFVGNGETVHKIELNLEDSGSPTDLQVAICTDNAGNPSTTCQAMDANICPGTTCTSGSYAWKSVYIAAGYATTSSTTYWIRMHHDLDATNYFIIGSAAETGTTIKRSANGSSWVTANSNYQSNYRVSSCAE